MERALSFQTAIIYKKQQQDTCAGLPWYNDTAKKASHQSNTNQSGIILSLSEKLQLSPAKFPNKHFTNDHGIVSVRQWKASKYAATAVGFLGCSRAVPRLFHPSSVCHFRSSNSNCFAPRTSPDLGAWFFTFQGGKS